MWLFEAKYINMDSGEKVTRKISFDGDNFYDNNGNELTYFDWDTNEPNLFYCNNAIIINKNQKWATIEYNEKHGAILEYNIKRLSDYFQNPRIYYQVLGMQEV